MKKNKLYFRSIDDTHCYSLEQHLEEARYEELETVTLIEAIPDDQKGYRWCRLLGEVVEREECSKRFCLDYTPNKSGRGTCVNRGKLFLHGEAVQFTVNQSK
jgi:hypothetical protein